MHRLQRINGHLCAAAAADDDNHVYIVSYGRTPLGSLNGSLSSLSATELGSIAVQHVIVNNKNIEVDEVYFGNVLSAGVGQAPAKQVSLGAGIPDTVPCTTVNKVCSSGMKAIMLGASAIKLKQARTVVAGGCESMSRVPHYAQLRTPTKLGNAPLVDGLLKDGLQSSIGRWDEETRRRDYHMGSAAELCAARYNISREAQDAYALASYGRAKIATETGVFKREIVPVTVKFGRGKAKVVDTDEEYSKIVPAKVPELRGVFPAPKGHSQTVTAANASAISDGAAAVLLVNSDTFKQRARHEWSCAFRIVAYADAARAPSEFTVAPAKAVEKLLSIAGLQIGDIDVFEINEAFSVVALANMKLLGDLPADKVNVYGGAVSLGHPLGCSGARIVCTLMTALTERPSSRYGVAAICNGGGGASAILLEKV